MKYKTNFTDPLYGRIEIWNWVLPLFHTKLAQRAREITMGTVPNQFRATGYLPSRFHHGVGAQYLVDQTRFFNSLIADEYDLRVQYVSAMMHDWGNSPYAHLIERLMKHTISHNGESFLEVLLDSKLGNDTKLALKEMGIDPQDVIGTVMGTRTPHSKLIHGDIDCDNLDNIYRYAHAMGWLNNRGYIGDGVAVARNFFWNGKDWVFRCDRVFHPNIHNDLHDWKEMRRLVYSEISSAPHQVVAAMLFSAAWTAHHKGFLTVDDFFGTDFTMTKLLCEKAPEMMRQIESWQWHVPMVDFTTTEPSNRLRKLVKRSDSRMELAEKFALKVGLDINDVTIYVGISNMERALNVLVEGFKNKPITADEFLEAHFPEEGPATRPKNYRVMVCVAPRFENLYKDKAKDFAESEIL